MDLKELALGIDPSSHWYYQSKKVPLIRFVREIAQKQKMKVMLVDVGAGSGFFMHELVRTVPELIAKVWLVDTGYTEAEVEASAGRQVEKTRALPDRIENAVVVMMDVLEHLEDDDAMLAGIKERCRGVNHFFITVPAFMDLWSGHDVYLGHHRRYNSSTLHALLRRGRFRRHRVFYLYFAIFPLVWHFRRIKTKERETSTISRPVPPAVNAILRRYNSLEMTLSRANTFFGVTCAGEGEI
jgi:hypothetical protein